MSDCARLVKRLLGEQDGFDYSKCWLLVSQMEDCMRKVRGETERFDDLMGELEGMLRRADSLGVVSKDVDSLWEFLEKCGSVTWEIRRLVDLFRSASSRLKAAR